MMSFAAISTVIGVIVKVKSSFGPACASPGLTRATTVALAAAAEESFINAHRSIP
jgi:hypothetical protein